MYGESKDNLRFLGRSVYAENETVHAAPIDSLQQMVHMMILLYAAAHACVNPGKAMPYMVK